MSDKCYMNSEEATGTARQSFLGVGLGLGIYFGIWRREFIYLFILKRLSKSMVLKKQKEKVMV